MPEPTALRIAEGIFGIAAFAGAMGVLVLVRAIRRGRIGTLVEGEVVRTARRITVRYVVDGKAYDREGSRNFNDAPPIGTRVAVRYLPGRPASAAIADENYAGAIAGLAVAAVFALLGGGMLWFAYHAG